MAISPAHWPDLYFFCSITRQGTSEKAIRKYVLGRGRCGAVREWIKTRERTEASDLEVYVLAALRTRGANYLRKALQAPVAAEKSITGYLVLFPQADPEPFAAVTLTTPHLFEMERGCLHCDHERPQRAPKPRKSSITGSVRYEFVCKHPNKPANPFPRGDIDNYVKAVQDALTAAGAWDDDVQVVEISEIKRYARPDESPHILIEVEPISIS